MHVDSAGHPDRSSWLVAASLAALCALGGVSVSGSPLTRGLSPFASGAAAALAPPVALLPELMHPLAIPVGGAAVSAGCFRLPTGPAMHDRVPIAALRAAYPKSSLTFADSGIRSGGSQPVGGVLVCSR